MIRLRVAADGVSLWMFCDECGEDLEALGETPTAASVAAAMRTIHPTCQWPKRWGDVPKVAVRHADERWPDTDGEAIPMTDARPNTQVHGGEK